MTPSSSSTNLPHLRIFVVEDNGDTLKYLLRYLEKCGHTVFHATSVQDALTALPDAHCDVLLSDIGLPDGDGWELLTQARVKSPVPPLFPVAMSGYGMASDRARSKEAGFRHHIVKPFTRGTLDTILAEATREIQDRT